VGRFVNREFKTVKAKSKKTGIASVSPVTSQNSVLDLAVEQTKAAGPVKQKPSVGSGPVVIVKAKAGRR
jgi:hypothetical protein